MPGRKTASPPYGLRLRLGLHPFTGFASRPENGPTSACGLRAFGLRIDPATAGRDQIDRDTRNPSRTTLRDGFAFVLD